MNIACKIIKIDNPEGLLVFEIGKRINATVFIASHITFDTVNKIVMVRDENNLVYLYNYKYIKVEPIMPFPQDGINVKNIIY